MQTTFKVLALATAVGLLSALPAQAQTRVTFKSAKTGSSYYQMGVQIAEAMKAGTKGAIIVTLEESQGSTQNVMEVRARGADYVFTTPPALVDMAQGAKGPFKDKGDAKFANIRALFPIPSLTMHFVARSDRGINNMTDLAGKTLLLGKGSFGSTEGDKYLKLFGLEGKVTLANGELSNAVPALKNGQIDAFVTAGSWPAPNVIEASASTPITLLALSDEQIAATERDSLTIPAGTYTGQKTAVKTTSLPVVAYSTTAMSDDTAYTLTKTYWDQKSAMSSGAAWWTGVDQTLMATITGKLHPGAVRYYKEAGFKLTAAQQ
jgi:uncharacterized protein